MKKVLSIIVCSLFIAISVHAQTFSPDRPGIGNGSFITPKKMVGVESGLEFSTNSFVDEFSIGQLLLRYGLAENLEVRAGLGSFTSQERQLEGGSLSNSGLEDMSVGAKYNFLSNNSKLNVSGLAELSLPVGDDAFSSDEAVPSLVILADQAINSDLSVSSNIGYSFGVGNVNKNWLFSLTPGISVGENVGVYGGYAGSYYRNGINEHWMEGGFTFGVSSGGQLDINAGYETESETFFIGTGFARGF